MAGRTSFNKRQKERSRQEKQREKAERKQQRKLEKASGGGGPEFGENVTIPDDSGEWDSGDSAPSSQDE
jgi:hypothetical protein